MDWLIRHRLELLLFAIVAIVAIMPFTGSITNEEQQRGFADWSSYGQWFGFLAGIFASLAFIVATRTFRLQQQQTREMSESAFATMRELTKQTSALNEAAEVNGLAALIHYCERYANIDASGESREQLYKLAAHAKDRLKEKLDLSGS